MIRRSFRFGLLLGLLGGAAFALTRVFGARSEPDVIPATPKTEPWPRLSADPAVPVAPSPRAVPDPALSAPAPPPVAPAPMPATKKAAVKAAPAKAPAVKKPAAKKTPAKKKAPVKAWVEPSGGVCPTSHPVKGKLSSKIFHLPGMLNYERTNPDRCYLDEAKAVADGLRAARR